MEDTLRARMESRFWREAVNVLILVLMEDTLRVRIRMPEINYKTCLNPCFNGRYSQSKKKFGSKIQKS